MQSVNEPQTNLEPNTELMEAADLKNITLTPEELFEIQKENLANSLMSSMVAVATKNARSFYAAQLLSEQVNGPLLDQVIEKFEDLGYSVVLTPEQMMGGQKVKVLTIDWTKA